MTEASGLGSQKLRVLLECYIIMDNNITTGKIYSQVIAKEVSLSVWTCRKCSDRSSAQRGVPDKTVQVVSLNTHENRFYVLQIVLHITNTIQDWIEHISKIPVDESGEEPDVCMFNLGGTVGDIESAPFVEVMPQFQFRVGHDNFALIHVSLVPDMHGEQKQSQHKQLCTHSEDSDFSLT